MATSHTILLLAHSPAPEGIRDAMQRKGHSTKICSSEADLATAVATAQDPILLVTAAEEVDRVPTLIERLVSLPTLHTVPMVIIGAGVDRFERYLNEHFALATTLVVPVSAAEVVQALDYIIKFYERIRSGRVRSSTPVHHEENLDEAPRRTHPLYQEASSVPDLVFQKLFGLGILERSLHGERYGLLKGTGEMHHPVLPVSQPHLREALETFLASLPKSSRGHLHRTAVLSDLLFDALGFSAELRDSARLAAMLFAWGLPPTRKELLRRDYLHAGQGAYRRELCSRIKDGALRLATELRVPAAANMVATMGRLIGREEVASDSTDSLIGSCLLAADLTDRVVTDSGVFQPQLAHGFIRRTKEEHFRDVHPLVLCCLYKILAEAIQVTALTATSKKARRIAKDHPAILESALVPLRPFEMKVPVSALSPGMKLSRPVLTFDGQEILTGDLTLDRDLIWRLWKLSAVRPLSGPLVVFSDA